MLLLVFLAIQLTFTSCNHSYTYAGYWTKEDKFLNEIFQAIESYKTTDDDFAFKDESPIDWSRVVSKSPMPTEKLFEQMLEYYTKWNFSKNFTFQEKSNNIDDIINLLKNGKIDEIAKYSDIFKYFIFVTNHSRESFVNLGRKTGLKKMFKTTHLGPTNQKRFCSMDPFQPYDFAYEYAEFSFTPFTNHSPYSRRFESVDYKCINAYGIGYPSSNSEKTIFLLGDGNQTILAPNINNTFLIGNDEKIIYGGSESDTFIIYGNKTNVKIHGSGGYDILDLSNMEHQTNDIISMVSSPHDEYSTLYSTSMINMEAYGISEIIGREYGVEDLYVTCKTLHVELKGGRQYAADSIYLLGSHIQPCEYNLRILLSGFTTVWGAKTNGKVTYIVDGLSNSDTAINSPCSSINDFLLRNVSLKNVKVITPLHKDGIDLYATSNANKTIKLSIQSRQCHLAATTLYFEDGFIKFTLKNKLLVFVRNINYSINEIISNWINSSSISTMVYMADKKPRSIIFNGNQITYYDKNYAPKKLQVFDAISQSIDTSLCPINSNTNYFSFESAGKFRLDIMCLDRSMQNYLFLTNFTKSMHKLGYLEVYIELVDDITQDLTFNIFLVDNDKNVENIGKIRFVDGKVNNIYQSINVINYNNSIIFDYNGKLTMVAAKPIIIDTKWGSITKITPNQFDRGTLSTFILNNTNSIELRAFGDGNSNNLILANIDALRPFVVILLNYGQYKEKYDTIYFGVMKPDGSVVQKSLKDIAGEPLDISEMYALYDKLLE